MAGYKNSRQHIMQTANILRSYKIRIYFLCISSDTVNTLRPLALLRASIFLPPTDSIRSLNPCLFFLFFTDG